MFELPLSPRAQRLAWLTAWASLAIAGAVTAIAGGMIAIDASVDAALSRQADPTSAPVVAMSLGVLVMVVCAALFVRLVVREADPALVELAPADETL